MATQLAGAKLASVPLLLLLLLVAAWGVESRAEVEECELDFTRLPKRVQPSHYNLEVKVNPEDKHFTGRVAIELQNDLNPNDVLCRSRAALSSPACDRAKIIVNAAESLEIEEVDYREHESGLAVPVARVCRSADLLVVELSRAPAQGSRGELKFAYSGQVQTDFTGLFRSDYRDVRDKASARKKKHLLLTQFESAMARKMFPCFDEPEFKATFELAVERPSHLTALANTQLVREEQLRHEGEPETDYTKSYFGRTPKMSSYLLALAVGEFDHLKSTVLGGAMELGIYVPPGRGREAEFTLGMIARGFLALHEFFGVPQPVSKIDFVTSKDFPGAMENWGLIAMDEAFALVDPTAYEATKMHYTYVTVIHELAHQWFGNLVTMKWWDDLWLNEGFASWISNELAHQLYPETEANFLYLIRGVHKALDADANPHYTHPIKNTALQTIQEIEDSFDLIAYEKSDAVINMLRHYLGAEQFKEGLRAYMAANQFRNTEDTDLWSALADKSGLDVRELMHSWIHQPGFPLLTVAQGDKNALEVHQARFPSAGAKTGRRQKWIVPVSMWVSDGAERLQKIKFVMSKAKDSINLPAWFDIRKPGHWLKLNSDFEGFFRVHYAAPELLAALRQPIEAKTMKPTDRLNVLEEALGLAKAEVLSDDQLREILSWFKGEDHDAVVDMIYHVIEHLQIPYDEDTQGFYQILVNHYEQNGRLADEATNGPSFLKRLARADVLDMLVTVGHEQTIQDCLSLFEATDGDVPMSIRDPLYAAVAKAGTAQQFRRVIELTKQMQSGNFRNDCVGYLRAAVKELPHRKRQLEQHFGKAAE